ncbi:MAG: succinylglutamate desuccinylase/aspartoacylase family protein [Bacteroidetes bacterium]|nr:succinylglutamate desuccinylase/aspartoacylase family protein [Bacteroidota bacterium]
MKIPFFILFLLIAANVLFAQHSTSAKKDHFVIQYVIGENTEYETPYYILRSEKEYPKILIDAGIHGDEVAGIYACDTVMKYINVQEGTVGFLPKVNIQAFNQKVRGVGVDLNQVFPGNKKGEIYEERLASDFMDFVRDFDPDYVINLHEAWTKFDENMYERQKDKSFGQTFITNSEKFSDFIVRANLNVNKFIPNQELKFHIQYFPFKPNHSMDNIIDKLKIPSYTVETLRTLPLEDRIKYQVLVILTFIEESGVKFTYDN